MTTYTVDGGPLCSWSSLPEQWCACATHRPDLIEEYELLKGIEQ